MIPADTIYTNHCTYASIVQQFDVIKKLDYCSIDSSSSSIEHNQFHCKYTDDRNSRFLGNDIIIFENLHALLTMKCVLSVDPDSDPDSDPSLVSMSPTPTLVGTTMDVELESERLGYKQKEYVSNNPNIWMMQYQIETIEIKQLCENLVKRLAMFCKQSVHSYDSSYACTYLQSLWYHHMERNPIVSLDGISVKDNVETDSRGYHSLHSLRNLDVIGNVFGSRLSLLQCHAIPGVASWLMLFQVKKVLLISLSWYFL